MTGKRRRVAKNNSIMYSQQLIRASQSESIMPCLARVFLCAMIKGAVLAFMLGLAHFSLEECADMYRRFGSEVFRQNRLVGTMKMGWSHSYYNTETWEAILQYAQ